MDVFRCVSSVALVSPCQMLHAATRALINNSSSSLAWHSEHYAPQTLLQILEHPVDLLILSLHVHQADLLHGMRLIKTLQFSHPTIRLIVVLDVNIPYLVSRLQDWGVKKVINMGLSLAGWRTLLQVACHNTICRPDEWPDETQAIGRIPRLSPKESRVIGYLLEGFSIPEIAALMQRSTKTVSQQKGRALHKMGVSNYAHLVAIGSVLQYGLGDSTEILLSASVPPDGFYEKMNCHFN